MKRDRTSIHILEGTTATGDRIYACGRTSRSSSRPTRAFGRATLDVNREHVTCVSCLKKYPDPPERKLRTNETRVLSACRLIDATITEHDYETLRRKGYVPLVQWIHKESWLSKRTLSTREALLHSALWQERDS